MLTEGETSLVSTTTPLPPASASDMANWVPPPLFSGVWPPEPPQPARLGSYGFGRSVQAAAAGHAEPAVKFSVVQAPNPLSKSWLNTAAVKDMALVLALVSVLVSESVSELASAWVLAWVSELVWRRGRCRRWSRCRSRCRSWWAVSAQPVACVDYHPPPITTLRRQCPNIGCDADSGVSAADRTVRDQRVAIARRCYLGRSRCGCHEVLMSYCLGSSRQP